MTKEHPHSHEIPCGCCMSKARPDLSRREFITGVGAAAGGLALSSLAAAAMNFTQEIDYRPTPPLPLKVQPVLTCGLFKPRPQTSWRPWGGFHTQEDINNEEQRISRELKQLTHDCEFPLEIMPLITLNSTRQAARVAQGDHDVLLMYAANSWVNVLEALTNPEKWTIVFVRHKSGPVYLWYEIAHNRYLRKTVDDFGQPGVDHQDVVVDKLDEIRWRLRALSGLKNTLNKKIVAVGGPAGWGAGGQKAPDLTRKIFKMDLRTVGYPELAELIKKARNNSELLSRCTRQAQEYLNQRGTDLQTDIEFVVNAFVLTEIFKNILEQAQTDALTVNQCMGTIMPLAQTTACLPLSLLNDAGYTAYCESDFVVIPSGILLHHISNRPVFLNDPTYPHDAVVTLAHCTAPRKMDGKNLEPAKILTHFESDYGAAPKVEMKIGQKITVINPDFDFKRWLGFEGEVIDNPFLDICRSQIDVKINGSCQTLNAQTRGFHWITCYGNYLNEVGYALKKLNIDWLNLSKP
ncbi:MAG: sugar isomerase [Phycisphaerae bacterium SM23_30]|nr:MAG: sugar isomerase [Phycisphaerae bacterium SM23_30]